MPILQSIFARKKALPEALTAFGFTRDAAGYVYAKALPGSGFVMTVRVTEGGAVSAEVTEPGFPEAYTLHLVEGAAGAFVGAVRAAYEALLQEIAEKCFETDVFQSAQARALIAYARQTHGDRPEFLWEKFPDNAVWRRQDNNKWYGALLTVSKGKLGLASAQRVEIIDLRAQPESIAALVDGKRYFAGWHMNKKNWYTMLLDGSVPTDEICRRLDASYALALS